MEHELEELIKSCIDEGQLGFAIDFTNALIAYKEYKSMEKNNGK